MRRMAMELTKQAKSLSIPERIVPKRKPNSPRPANAILTNATIWDLEFMQCIDEALTRIVDHPRAFPVVYKSLRRTVVRRFPFAILYEVPHQISVTAIFHSRRDPAL